MSNCVFAHACYGVIMDDEDAAKLNGLGNNSRDRQEEVEEALPTYPELVCKLCNKYNAGEEACFFYTGDEDVHYDNSGTPEDTWIIGYGVMQFPGVEVPGAFREIAEWHLWVTT